MCDTPSRCNLSSSRAFWCGEDAQMMVFITLVFWLLVAVILLAIVREVLATLKFQVPDRIFYLIFLLVALVLILNAVGIMGEPWTLGRLHC